jgi:hypothetical protein
MTKKIFFQLSVFEKMNCVICLKRGRCSVYLRSCKKKELLILTYKKSIAETEGETYRFF